MSVEMMTVVYGDPNGYSAALQQLRGLVSSAGWTGVEYCSVTVGSKFVLIAVRLVGASV